MHDEIVEGMSGGEGKGVIGGGKGIGAVGPEVVEAVTEEEGAEVEDRGGAWFGPEHAGLLESGADDGLTARFNDAASDEPPLSAVSAVVHSSLVALKESQVFSGQIGRGTPWS